MHRTPPNPQIYFTHVYCDENRESNGKENGKENVKGENDNQPYIACALYSQSATSYSAIRVSANRNGEHFYSSDYLFIYLILYILIRILHSIFIWASSLIFQRHPSIYSIQFYCIHGYILYTFHIYRLDSSFPNWILKFEWVEKKNERKHKEQLSYM